MVLREYDEAAHIANEKRISFEDGEALGKEKILLAVIRDYLEDGISKEKIIEKLITRYEISVEKAEEYFSKCTKYI